MKTVPARARRAVLAATACAALLPALPARAWDPETHVSIVRVALAISPAAAARIRDNYEAFYGAVASPDPFDKKCSEHPYSAPPRDSAAIAAETLDQILAGKLMASPNARAHAIGRVLHYVSDTAMPEAALRKGNTLDPFWAETTFAVFRESRPLTRPWADAIRRIGAEARWGVDSRSTRAYAYRLAVNLVADTLLALPADSAPEDRGPVVFGVDRTFKGPPPSARSESLASKVKAIKARSAAAKATPAPDAADADPGTPPTDRPGLHLVEWVTRPSGSGTEVRALLYNNDDRCAEQIAITGASSAITVQGRVAPHALRAVSLTTSASPVATLRAAGRYAACAPPFGADAGTPEKTRVILSSVGRPLDVERPLPERDVTQ